jgi:hypothetical protein
MLLLIQEVYAQEVDTVKVDIVKYNDYYYLVNLPYSVPENIDLVFDHDTPLVINIVGIYIDGKKLEYNPDTPIDFGFEPIPYFNLLKINQDDSNNECYLTMWWSKRTDDEEALYWHGGRGAVFEQEDRLREYPFVKSYKLEKGMNNIIIKYKILIPYNGISLNDLYELKDDDEHYSTIFSVSINLDEVWN